MNVQRLRDIADLVHVVHMLYCHFRLEAPGEFIIEDVKTSHGTDVKISINSNISYLDLGHPSFMIYMSSRTPPFSTELWDDTDLVLPKMYPEYSIINHNIRLAETDRLDKAAITTDYLPRDFSFSPDDFDPWLFQRLTVNTIHEIESKILSRFILKRLTPYEEDWQGYSPTVKLGLSQFDTLQDCEIVELRNLLFPVLEERSENYYEFYKQVYA